MPLYLTRSIEMQADAPALASCAAIALPATAKPIPSASKPPSPEPIAAAAAAIALPATAKPITSAAVALPSLSTLAVSTHPLTPSALA